MFYGARACSPGQFLRLQSPSLTEVKIEGKGVLPLHIGSCPLLQRLDLHTDQYRSWGNRAAGADEQRLAELLQRCPVLRPGLVANLAAGPSATTGAGAGAGHGDSVLDMEEMERTDANLHCLVRCRSDMVQFV